FVMRRIASAAAAVRKVTSAQGRPPATRASASGSASAGSSITITGASRNCLSRSSASCIKSIVRGSLWWPRSSGGLFLEQRRERPLGSLPLDPDQALRDRCQQAWNGGEIVLPEHLIGEGRGSQAAQRLVVAVGKRLPVRP